MALSTLTRSHNYEDLDGAIVHASTIADLSRDRLLDVLNHKGIVLVRGLINPLDIVRSKQRMAKFVDPKFDNPGSGESPEDLYANHQKFSVGSGDRHDKDFPKCLRTFYNPIFAEDVYGMRSVFREAARLRNLIMGFANDFAIDGFDKGFWTASRIHHYPAGGGFMGEHCEDYIPEIYKNYDVETYFQPLIVMSKRGTSGDCDYATGGGYYVAIDGERVFYEDVCELGDIVVYNTSIMHGVEEIDIDVAFRQDATRGRYAGFVTMYRDFRE